jgi:pantetheine-phosphate adenylyltransferase
VERALLPAPPSNCRVAGRSAQSPETTLPKHDCLPRVPPNKILLSSRHSLRGPLNKVSALYPGSFDPPTNGHLDLIERGAKIFEELVVGILKNSEKVPMFSLPERIEMLHSLTAHLKNVRIEAFHGLMVEYAKSINATCVLRGIRAVSDYEYELQMALMNRKLEPTLETVFMMPADKYSYVSSRLVREVAQAGGPVRGLVPEVVEQKLRERLEPAYKFHDEAAQETARSIGIREKKRKKS